jgi:hypothetical protein
MGGGLVLISLILKERAIHVISLEQDTVVNK